PVSLMPGPRDLHHQRDAPSRFVAQRGRGIYQAAPNRQLHIEKRQAIIGLAHLVDRQNIWMIETRGGFRFQTKPSKRFARLGLKTEKTLQRNDASRMTLARPIDDAHAAATNFFKDLIVADAPIGVAKIDFIEHCLETFLPLDISEAALQQTIQTKTAPNPRA